MSTSTSLQLQERKYHQHHSIKPSPSRYYRKRNLLYVILVVVIVSFFVNTIFLFHHIDNNLDATVDNTVKNKNNEKETKRQLQPSQPNNNNNHVNDYGLCAILLFGLPRGFEQYVLPSLIKNVIQINAKYGCDYYVHYYHQDREISNGRSGRGGQLNPDSIQKLLPSTIYHEMNNHNNHN